MAPGRAQNITGAITRGDGAAGTSGHAYAPAAAADPTSELIDVQGTGNVVPEVGQSIAVAQQQAIQRMAEQIVGLMEKPW